ncbi:hypothetical protein OMK64_01760 [Cellulomonas fimi]|uniref:hypothetical protein n=1 Tax=Cellulomonas fimi TaxID=1708 RepID=UPI00234CA5A3|nr:hypothetical protein [Cellulomonas fimi]MDC7120258.1 hypothetical protein [Cellulomonas fimi]
MHKRTAPARQNGGLDRHDFDAWHERNLTYTAEDQGAAAPTLYELHGAYCRHLRRTCRTLTPPSLFQFEHALAEAGTPPSARETRRYPAGHAPKGRTIRDRFVDGVELVDMIEDEGHRGATSRKHAQQIRTRALDMLDAKLAAGEWRVVKAVA